MGKAFADNDSVVVAKIDATANDIPDTNKFKVRLACRYAFLALKWWNVSS